jgi:hypothetical protein
MAKLRLSIEDGFLRFPKDASEYPGFEVWPDPWGNEYGFGLPQGVEYWMKVHGIGAFIIDPGYQKVSGFPENGLSLTAFRDAFFHGVAPWLLQRREWDCLHGSSVLTENGVVVFCGPTGRGKSTLARACADRGAVPYADDAVPFLIRNGTAMSARIPQRIRLREPAASRFPDSPDSGLYPDGSREIFYDLEPSLRPLRCVYWLAPMAEPAAAAAATIRRVNPVEALPLMLSVAHCMSLKDPDCNRKMVRNYLWLVKRTPVFRLSFVSDLDRIPAVLDCLERQQREL